MGDEARAQEGAVATSAPPQPREPHADRQARALAFSEWQAGFRTRALGEGIRPEIFDSVMTGVTPSSRVRELDGAQPEFVRPVWQYLDSAVSETRVANGRSAYSRLRPTLTAIEERYGTDAQIVTAVWGLETAYGSVRGDFPVAQSLATLAHDGRRRDWAERELIGAMRIVQDGDVRAGSLVGSWAGAMGHTQFMPTSYHRFAQDFDGDGQRNIWSEDPTDALASTAHYLAENGWTPGQPWGIEVRLPDSFDWLLSDRSQTHPASFWTQAGVTTFDGGQLPDHGPARLLAPVGAGGPAFLTYENFEVIKTYNNSTSYALAIGLLGDRIEGRTGVRATWPRDRLPLSRSDSRELQERLTAMGYDTQGADGRIGPNTERAIRQFQVDRGLTPDGTATDRLLALVRQG
ncbi:lytic murein transglycosylase [Pontivivens ytuae]|uniref:Lytic murein transglycosylase n=2 Tax=Pontivivens ytuae TaxID=2789856 RepID=A0A7S9LVS1_9RHOB|nr:lytic murein transglycosylase [Pontivivens ytuae]